MTQKIFKEIGEEYARRFSPYYISKDKLKEEQDNILMTCRPSMKKDIEIAGLQSGLFIYSLWNGYRDNDYQKVFEDSLKKSGFVDEVIHTSGHATVADIHKVISALGAKTIIPIHTMEPGSFVDRFENVVLKEDGVSFKI